MGGLARGGDQQQRDLRPVAEHVAQQRVCVLVGQVEVVEDEEHGLVFGHPREQVGQPQQELGALAAETSSGTGPGQTPHRGPGPASRRAAKRVFAIPR